MGIFDNLNATEVGVLVYLDSRHAGYTMEYAVDAETLGISVADLIGTIKKLEAKGFLEPQGQYRGRPVYCVIRGLEQ